MGRGASLARSRRRRLPQLSNQENDMTAAILAKQKMSEAEWETRCSLAALYRIFHRLRMTDFIYTHLSARVPGEDGHFLINRYGEMFDEITASSLVKMDLDGNVVGDPGNYKIGRAHV